MNQGFHRKLNTIKTEIPVAGIRWKIGKMEVWIFGKKPVEEYV